MSICGVACGNGVRDSKENEECDDSNLVNSDGCDSSCKIEEGYACLGGSDSTVDVCYE